MKTERDIAYTKAGETELKLDLAAPEQGDGPFPAVLVIHGGAWRREQGGRRRRAARVRRAWLRGRLAAIPVLPQGGRFPRRCTTSRRRSDG